MITTSALAAAVAVDTATPATRRRYLRAVGFLALATGAVALPWLVNAYLISLAGTALILGVLAMSTQLLSGIAGLPSIGQAAYLGVGAYTAALLARTVTTSGPLHLAAATVLAATIAGLIGALAVRTRAVTYLMVTLAVGELVHITAVQAATVTGGSEGIHTPPVVPLPGLAPIRLDGHAYLYVLGWSTILAIGVAWLLRTRFTLILRAVAEHEPRARASGHRSGVHLWAAHTIAGGLAGAAGALLVAAHRYTSPADLAFDISALALIAAAIGVRSMTGAVAAAIGLVAVRDLVGGALGGYSPILIGVVCVVVAYLPRHRTAELRRRRPWRTQ